MIRWPWKKKRPSEEDVEDVHANNEELRKRLTELEEQGRSIGEWAPPVLSSSDQPYQDSYEHLLDELTRIDYLLWLRVEQWRAELGEVAGTSGGYYIPDEKIDLLLRPGVDESGGHISTGSLHEEQYDYAEQLDQHIEKRKQLALDRGIELRLVTLAHRFGLEDREVDVLLVAAAPELDSKYETVYGYLHDNITRTRPTVDLILRMFSPLAVTRLIDREVFTRTGPLRKNGLIRLSGGDDLALASRSVAVDERITDYLLGNDAIDDALSEYVEVKKPKRQLKTGLDGAGRSEGGGPHRRPNELVLDEAVRVQLKSLSSQNDVPSGGGATTLPLMVHFYGPYGSGRLAAATALTADSGRETGRERELLVADVRGLVTGGLRTTVELLIREARLRDADVAISSLESLDDESEADVTFLLRALDEFDGRVYLFGDESLKTSQRHGLAHHRFVGVHFPIPSYESRKELWSAVEELPDDVSVSDLAGKFRLTAGQIEDAVEAAKSRSYGNQLTAEDVYAGCRSQSREKLSTLGRVVDPNYEWDDIVLPEDTEAHLREVAAQIRYQGRVYSDWGFKEKFSLGNGVIALFTGPSGTGKTMAAEVIANDAGLDLYKIDLSSVVSKYIGETEKNLSEVFDEAENSNAILFFDEADALFGKRSEVSDAHDRYANIEVNYLLQRVEEHDGAVILTTNFEGNIDDAFTRRIHLSVDFSRPDREARKQIWQDIFPVGETPDEKTLEIEASPNQVPVGGTPVGDLDYEFLSTFELTGGNIKNIALAAAFLAAAGWQVSEKEDFQWTEQKVPPEAAQGDETSGDSTFDVLHTVEMEHVLWATRRELRKNGKLVKPKDFGAYRDLLL